MYELTDDTLSIQSGDSYTPIVQVNIGGVGFMSTNPESGLLFVETVEEGQSYRATIEVRPSVLAAIHPGILKWAIGRTVNIKWGYAGTTQIVRSPPLFVVGVSGASEPGSVVARFDCMGWWELLASSRVLSSPFGRTYDSGVNEAATDMTLQDTDKSWTVNEHIGRVVTCNGKTMTIAFNTSDMLTGASWNGGGNPGSPHSYTINSDTREGAAESPPVWDRDTTIRGILNEILSGRGNVWLDDDDGVINTYRPYYEADGLESVLTTVRNLLDMSSSYIKIRDDGFHIVSPRPSSPLAYTYNLRGLSDDHPFFKRSDSVKAIIPNRIIMVPSLPTTDEAPDFVGTAVDQDSVDRLGYLDFITSDEGLQSEGEANTRAYHILERLKAESSAGLATVPMNIGQELYDRVAMTDARLGTVPIYSFVGMMKKIWRSGEYYMELGLGGLMPHLSGLYTALTPSTPAIPVMPTPYVPPSAGPVYGPPSPVYGPPLPPNFVPPAVTYPGGPYHPPVPDPIPSFPTPTPPGPTPTYPPTVTPSPTPPPPDGWVRPEWPGRPPGWGIRHG